MGTRPHHNESAPAALEVVFRGLYAALVDDPALRNSLVMFLPYYIKYASPEPRVKLIHPRTTLCLDFPQDGPAWRFLEDNRDIMKLAASSGRDRRSYAHQLVKNDLKEFRTHKHKAGGYIPAEYRGHIQYRQILGANGTHVPSWEYNIDSCPHMYPVLGVLRQADGRMIGMVSMDFGARLCEKVAATFNSFITPLSTIRLWDHVPGVDIEDYHANATMTGSWCDAPMEAQNPLHSAFANKSEKNHVCEQLQSCLTTDAWEQLNQVLNSVPKGAVDQTLTLQHRLLKALQGADQFVPALWACLGKGTRVSLSENHFKLYIKASTETDLIDINLAAGQLHKEWQWCDCLWNPPNWLLLRGALDDKPDKVATKWLQPNGLGGKRGLRAVIWSLARAVCNVWQDQYLPLAEFRIATYNLGEGSVKQFTATLRSCCSRTPVTVILGKDKMMVVAIRGNWGLG